MREILDEQFYNFDLSTVQFRGKLAGKNWRREQSIDWVERTRVFILVMAGVVLYPVLANHLFYNLFSLDFFIERLVISTVLILCFLFFRKFSLASMIISLLPIGLIIINYLVFTPELSFRRLGFNCAIFCLIVWGIYSYFKAIKLSHELVEEIKNKNPEAVV